jgi:hypothetical protein
MPKAEGDAVENERADSGKTQIEEENQPESDDDETGRC